MLFISFSLGTKRVGLVTIKKWFKFTSNNATNWFYMIINQRYDWDKYEILKIEKSIRFFLMNWNKYETVQAIVLVKIVW